MAARTNHNLNRVLLVVVLMLATYLAFSHATAKADDPRPPNRCTSSPSWGFTRWQPVGGSALWNLCASDSYGPPEWLYWNYLYEPEHDDPGSGPYYTQVANSVYAWASAQSRWELTYKSGNWIDGVDVFIDEAYLEFYLGVIEPYWCTSQTSCTERTSFTQGPYNLVYMYINTNLSSGTAEGTINHEFGHAFGLEHPTTGCFDTPSVMFQGLGCLTYPAAADADAVDWVYPEGVVS